MSRLPVNIPLPDQMSPPLRNLAQVQAEFWMPCHTTSNSFLIAVYSLRTFSMNKTQSFPNEWETLVGMNGSPWISWCSRPNGLHISCQNLELDPNNFSASSSQGWQCWHHIYLLSRAKGEFFRASVWPATWQDRGDESNSEVGWY